MSKNSMIRKLYVVMFLSGCLSICCIFLLNTYDKKETIDSYTKEKNRDSTLELPQTTNDTIPTENSINNYDYYKDDSIQRVVNKNNTISKTYVPYELVPVNVPQYAEQTLVPEAARNLEKMFQDAHESGIELYLVSGYRSYQEQIKLQEYYIETQGIKMSEKIDCVPGASEHQLGLAVDLSTTDHQYELNTDFGTTATYEWLVEHCAEYGYILRYPEGKEENTGIMYSPWNFRYVGEELAKELSKSGETMEEYFKLDKNEQ